MRFPLLVGLAASAAILGACAAPQTGMTLPAMSRQPISTRETTVYALHGLPSGQSANWAQPGHDAAHTGYNPLETILGSSNVASLQTGFNFTTGNGIFAPMVESNNVLYADSTDGNLYAVDVRTGAQLWSYPAGYGDWPQGVAVSGNRVFVTCSLDSSHAGLCRLNASTGKLAWSWAIYSDAGQPVGSSPYTGPSVSGKIVVMGESDTLSFGHVGYLVALNTTTGKITWQIGNCGVTHNNDCNGLDDSTPAIQKQTVYYGAAVNVSGVLYYSVCAVALSSGANEWCTTVGDPNAAISVKGTLVYANTFSSGSVPETLYALNATSGATVWTHAFTDGNNQDLTPAITGASVFVSGGHNLYALNAKTGKKRWETVGPVGGVISAPSVANGVVYTSCGGLCAFDAAKGTLLWNSRPGISSSTASPPFVVNGVLYGVCVFQSACSYHL